MHWQQMLWVGAGGFLGANARYWIGLAITPRLSAVLRVPLPYGTAFVNITGSLLLALFLAYAAKHTSMPDQARLLIGTGFFGAYTTFSTYANESIALIQQGAWLSGIAYIIGTNLLCLIGVLIGLWLANYLF